LPLAPPGRLIDVGGHRLHVTSAGDGSPPVLLESGIAASALSWTVVQPAIAEFTRVHAYDRAGLGWSDVPSCPRTFDRIVDELRAVLAEIAPRERCVLVGHSFGSFVVRGFAMRYPDAVAGLVLVDPAMEWLTPTPDHVYRLRRARYLSRIGAWLARIGVVRVSLAFLVGGTPAVPRRVAGLFGATVSRTLDRLVTEVRKLPPSTYPLMQSIWSQPKCFHAMADHLLTLERDAGAIARLVVPGEIPTVVISSGNQPPEQLGAHRVLAGASNAGRHIMAARSAHWVQFDEPELIIGAVRELVESHRAAPRRALP
jgi:pimeloyl-ACP methyl ester carboxylesterase